MMKILSCSPSYVEDCGSEAIAEDLETCKRKKRNKNNNNNNNLGKGMASPATK